MRDYREAVTELFSSENFYKYQLLPCIKAVRPFTLETTRSGHLFFWPERGISAEVSRYIRGKSALSFDELAMMLCVYTGNNERLAGLLAANPGLNINAKNSDRESALEISSYKYNLEGMRLLLEHGADPNTEDSRGDNCMACVCGSSNFFSISGVDLRLI